MSSNYWKIKTRCVGVYNQGHMTKYARLCKIFDILIKSVENEIINLREFKALCNIFAYRLDAPRSYGFCNERLVVGK